MEGSEIEKKIDSILEGLLSAKSYSLTDKQGYVRKTDTHHYSINRSQVVSMGLPDSNFEVLLAGYISILEVEEYWKDLYHLTMPKLDGEVNENFMPPTLRITPDLTHLKDDSPKVFLNTNWLRFEDSGPGWIELKDVLGSIVDLFVDYSDTNSPTISQLDEDVNSKIELDALDGYQIHKQGFIYRRIILAKLNQNPLFEKICEYHRKAFPKYIALSIKPGQEHLKNIPVIFEKVVERLNNTP